MPLTKRMTEFIEHLCVCEETGLTDKDWCELIGVKYDTAQGWKQREDFKEALAASKAEYDAGASVLGRKTFVWALEEAIVNYKTAKKDGEMTEARHWWRVLRELTEPEAGMTARVDYSAWSDEDLEAEVFRRGLNEVEKAVAEAKGVSA